MAKNFLTDCLLILIVGVSVKFCTTDGEVCTKKTACLCELGPHERINLTDITRDKFLSDTIGELTFFYHGCTNAHFTPEKYNVTVTNTTVNHCNDTTLCLYNSTDKTLVDLGKVQNSHIQPPTKEIHSWELIFISENSTNISAIIQLVCIDTKESYLKADKPEGSGSNLLLFSPYACKVKEKEHHDDNLSTGSVLLILSFTGVLLYFVGGALVLHLLRGATGLEMIPNLDFWRDLPYLVRDGLAFLLNGCRPMVSSGADVYDRI